LYEVEFWNNKIKLKTHNTLFSPNHPDIGTMEMLKYVDLNSKDKILDLGCGCGIVGILIAKVINDKNVYMIDCNSIAVDITKENAILNNVENVNVVCGNGPDAIKENDFSLILSNPPYHTDFSVAKEFIEKSYKKLINNGKLILVVKRLTWYKNKLISVFGGVKVIKDNGYYILISEKRQKKIIKSKKTTTRKHLKKISKK
jgi:16S rRNA (guanine1207-N2)-methyltransferase